jgi:hypothetical protein
MKNPNDFFTFKKARIESLQHSITFSYKKQDKFGFIKNEIDTKYVNPIHTIDTINTSDTVDIDTINTSNRNTIDTINTSDTVDIDTSNTSNSNTSNRNTIDIDTSNTSNSNTVDIDTSNRTTPNKQEKTTIQRIHCKYCDKSYSKPQSYVNHLDSIHKQTIYEISQSLKDAGFADRILCHLCLSTCKSLQSFQKHCKSTHKRLYSIDQNNQFINPINLMSDIGLEYIKLDTISMNSNGKSIWRVNLPLQSKHSIESSILERMPTDLSWGFTNSTNQLEHDEISENNEKYHCKMNSLDLVTISNYLDTIEYNVDNDIVIIN